MASPNGEAFLLNPNAPAKGMHYPHARIVPTSAKTIYVSGIAAISPEGVFEGVTENADGTFTTDIRKQTAAVLKRIDDIIKGASGGKGGIQNVIDSVVYLTDIPAQYEGMNEEWNKVFTSRETAPARATIGLKELPNPRFIVEVKATAVVEF